MTCNRQHLFDPDTIIYVRRTSHILVLLHSGQIVTVQLVQRDRGSPSGAAAVVVGQAIRGNAEEPMFDGAMIPKRIKILIGGQKDILSQFFRDIGWNTA